jgi:hypothetical protein
LKSEVKLDKASLITGTPCVHGLGELRAEVSNDEKDFNGSPPFGNPVTVVVIILVVVVDSVVVVVVLGLGLDVMLRDLDCSTSILERLDDIAGALSGRVGKGKIPVGFTDGEAVVVAVELAEDVLVAVGFLLAVGFFQVATGIPVALLRNSLGI